jgi:hypothetical protein
VRGDGEKLAVAAAASDGCKKDGEELDGPAKKRGRMHDGSAADLGEDQAASTVAAAGEENSGLAAPVSAVGAGAEPGAVKKDETASEPQTANEAETSAL